MTCLNKIDILRVDPLYNKFVWSKSFLFLKTRGFISRLKDDNEILGKIEVLTLTRTSLEHRRHKNSQGRISSNSAYVEFFFTFWPHRSTALWKNWSYFVFQKTSWRYSKTPKYLFSDGWSIQELIGTKIGKWGTKIRNSVMGVCEGYEPV